MYPITRWPVPVYVSRILDDGILATLFVKQNQIELIAWGTFLRRLKQQLQTFTKWIMMPRVKPSARNPPQEMQVSEVQFLGEQNGAPERLLKGKLADYFNVTRAFIALI